MSNKIIKTPFRTDPEDPRQVTAVEAVERYVENCVLVDGVLVGPFFDKKTPLLKFRSLAELGGTLSSIFDQYYFTNKEDRKDHRICLAACKVAPCVVENAMQQMAWHLADTLLSRPAE